MKKLILPVLALTFISLTSLTNGNNEPKVKVLHNGNELEISPNALKQHLDHGDVLAADPFAVPR